MGFVVLHIDKATGNDAGMTAHIERTIDPANADKERTHLNRELVDFPDEVDSRTQAIQHRLNTAGLTRKIGTNQVRALRIMLSGTPEDMQRIEAGGKLGDWCEDNLSWLRKTYGADNLVSAVLHLDETTPHIHATVVPIVTGERRKTTDKPTDPTKKQYRKKSRNAARLCADDVMARPKLKEYQDTYAEAMNKYGLMRGIDGSQAKHTTNLQYYRNLEVQKQAAQEKITHLQAETEARRQEVLEYERQAEQARTCTQQAETELVATRKERDQEKARLAGDKLKNTAAEVGTKIASGIGSLIGTTKIERQQQEIEDLKAGKAALARQIKSLEAGAAAIKREHDTETSDLQKQLNLINYWLPDTPQIIKHAEYYSTIGFTDEQTRDLIAMKPVTFTGELYSSEFRERFKVSDALVRFERNPADNRYFRVTINGTDSTRWFRQKNDEWLQRFGVKQRQAQTPNQPTGRKL